MFQMGVREWGAAASMGLTHHLMYRVDACFVQLAEEVGHLTGLRDAPKALALHLGSLNSLCLPYPQTHWEPSCNYHFHRSSRRCNCGRGKQQHMKKTSYSGICEEGEKRRCWHWPILRMSMVTSTYPCSALWYMASFRAFSLALLLRLAQSGAAAESGKSVPSARISSSDRISLFSFSGWASSLRKTFLSITAWYRGGERKKKKSRRAELAAMLFFCAQDTCCSMTG